MRKKWRADTLVRSRRASTSSAFRSAFGRSSRPKATSPTSTTKRFTSRRSSAFSATPTLAECTPSSTATVSPEVRTASSLPDNSRRRLRGSEDRLPRRRRTRSGPTRWLPPSPTGSPSRPTARSSPVSRSSTSLARTPTTRSSSCRTSASLSPFPTFSADLPRFRSYERSYATIQKSAWAVATFLHNGYTNLTYWQSFAAQHATSPPSMVMVDHPYPGNFPPQNNSADILKQVCTAGQRYLNVRAGLTDLLLRLDLADLSRGPHAVPYPRLHRRMELVYGSEGPGV